MLSPEKSVEEGGKRETKIPAFTETMYLVPIAAIKKKNHKFSDRGQHKSVLLQF